MIRSTSKCRPIGFKASIASWWVTRELKPVTRPRNPMQANERAINVMPISVSSVAGALLCVYMLSRLSRAPLSSSS